MSDASEEKTGQGARYPSRVSGRNRARQACSEATEGCRAYPFTAPAVMPWMNWRWNTRKAMTRGRVASRLAAMMTS